jgi:hypothetical protein
VSLIPIVNTLEVEEEDRSKRDSKERGAEGKGEGTDSGGGRVSFPGRKMSSTVLLQ